MPDAGGELLSLVVVDSLIPMTAIDPTVDIPASVDTLEKLLVWAASAFRDLHTNETYPEQLPTATDSGLRAIVDNGQGSDTDGRVRFLSRFSIEIDVNAAASIAGKFWTFAVENGNSALPTRYTTDV